MRSSSFANIISIRFLFMIGLGGPSSLRLWASSLRQKQYQRTGVHFVTAWTTSTTTASTATIRARRRQARCRSSLQQQHHKCSSRFLSSWATRPLRATTTEVFEKDRPSAASDDDNNNNSNDQDYSLDWLTDVQNIQRSVFGGIPYWNTGSYANRLTDASPDTASNGKFRCIFILGGPGAGKGTQCDLMLEKNYPVQHLSVGQLLRDEQAKPGSSTAALIAERIQAGQIVPVEISLQLVQQAMQASRADTAGVGTVFLIDGFPRNEDNLAGWCRNMKDVATTAGVLVYACPLEVLKERIIKRAKESDTVRSDDNLKSLEKRFQTFQHDTMPVIDQLRAASTTATEAAPWSVSEISSDQSISDVWCCTENVLNTVLQDDVLTANQALLQAVQANNVELYQDICDATWFANTDLSAAAVMQEQEGSAASAGAVDTSIRNANVEFLAGNQCSVAYDRCLTAGAGSSDSSDEGGGEEGKNVWVREKRIWSHQGASGWRNTHFQRTPLPVD